MRRWTDGPTHLQMASIKNLVIEMDPLMRIVKGFRCQLPVRHRLLVVGLKLSRGKLAKLVLQRVLQQQGLACGIVHNYSAAAHASNPHMPMLMC